MSQTDRQTNSLTPHTGVCGFFLQVKSATSLLALLAVGQIEIITLEKHLSPEKLLLLKN